MKKTASAMTEEKKSLTIVFAGTPAFTLPCLNALAASNHDLKAIYTQPDRPAGRGRKSQVSAVKEWAQKHHLPIYQPLNFKDSETIHEITALAPDIIVVIAYGLILPRSVLELPRLGCINVHASLLPRWRGASPIQQAILHGDQQTGVTIMRMDIGMDTGDMLTQATCPIHHDDNASTLHDRLAQLAVTPLLETLNKLATDGIHGIKQDALRVTYAPKINKEDAVIAWHQPALTIDQQIRAFYPWPIAYTHADDIIIRVHQAQVIEKDCSEPPGTVLSIDKHGMLVSTGHQALLIERIQFPGARAMSIADWMNARRHQLHVNLVLGAQSLT